ITILIIVANHVFGFLQNSLTNDLVVVGVAIAIMTVLFEQAEIRKILHIPTAGVWEKIRASFKAIIMGIRRAWRWVSLPLNIFLIGVLIFVYHSFDPQLPPTTGQADLSSARTVLQGLAIEQEKVNTGGRNCLIPQGTDCLKLYLMIANIGKTSNNAKNGTNTDVYANQVVQQIINLKQDKGY